jgi:hypothetical protein
VDAVTEPHGDTEQDTVAPLPSYSGHPPRDHNPHVYQILDPAPESVTVTQRDIPVADDEPVGAPDSEPVDQSDADNAEQADDSTAKSTSAKRRRGPAS